MNPDSAWTSAWLVLGPLTVQVALVVAGAALWQRFVATAFWRRTIWQVCTASLAVLIVCEITDILRATLSRWTVKPPTINLAVREMPSPSVSSWSAEPSRSIQLRPDFLDEVMGRKALREPLGAARNSKVIRPIPDPGLPIERAIQPIAPATAPGAPLPVSRSAETDSSFASGLGAPISVGAWLGIAWMIGTAVLAVRTAIGHFAFLLCQRRRRAVLDPSLRARVERLAKRLGIRRTVRLAESSRWRGPVVFGLFRPVLVLPKEFSRDFTEAQQDAMLAHELAHLAAHDPAWQLLASLVSATLWWHPLVWWTRTQWQTAAETAADEASLLVTNGPNELAECLVKLGQRLAPPQPLGWIGVEGNGFRSALGRRVERLMKLHGHRWHPPNRIRGRLAQALGPMFLAALAMFGAAWSSPAIFEKGETMNTLHKTWKQSWASLALISTLASEPIQTPAAEAAPPVDTKAAAEIGNASEPIQPPAAPASPAPAMDPQMMKRYGLRAAPSAPTPGAVRAKPGAATWDKGIVRSKLDLVVPEMIYVGTPLSDVLKDLGNVARLADPNKLGLNFLISNSPSPTTAIDPATGESVRPSRPVEPLENLTVRFNLPLRSCRIKDVLDVIVKVADHPIHYTVEDYGVVFAPGHRRATDLDTTESERAPLYKMDPELMKRYGLLPRGANVAGTPSAIKESTRKSEKLESLVLSEVFFDNLPLSEVARFLFEKSRELDPAKQGLNFVIRPNPSKSRSEPGAPVRPNGQTLSSATVEQVDLENVMIRLSLPLRSVRLKDVLDAITRVADRPIRYTVEEFGVLFSAAPDAAAAVSSPDKPAAEAAARYGSSLANSATLPPGMAQRYGLSPANAVPGALEARTFRVDANTLVKGLERAFGITLEDESAFALRTLERRNIELRTLERRQIELGLAKKELEEARRKVDVGADSPEILERAKAAVDLFQTTNELQRVQIRLRLAEQDLQRLQKMFENGKASTLDVERAKAAIELLELDRKALESGRSPAVLSSQEAGGRADSSKRADARSVQQALQQLFVQLGVNLDQPGKGVFYNDLTGILMARVTSEDMKTVQAAVETLGGALQSDAKGVISMLGAVEKPGVIEIAPGQKMSLAQAIAESGGFKKNANKNRIEVSRKSELFIRRLSDLNSSDSAFLLEPGDVVHVRESLF